MVFGPIKSRRLGISLGINLLPTKGKICSFNCIYCECGWTEHRLESRLQMPKVSDIEVALEEKLKPNLERDLDRYKKEVKGLITSEIVKRYYYRKGEVQQSLRDDNVLQKAIDVLKDKKLYDDTLKPSSEKKEEVVSSVITKRQRPLWNDLKYINEIFI